MRSVAKLAVVALTAVAALDLTPENWEEATIGKPVFLKFYAPWCGHCKNMAPAWQKLMDQYADSNTTVAEVDCTAGGEAICGQVGIRSFPTIKYGDVSDLEDYTGGRDFDSLEAFAKDLKPVCSVHNLDACSEEKAVLIRELQTKTPEELEQLVAQKQQVIIEAEETFEQELEKLKETYMGLMKERDDTVEKVKKDGLSLMKSVRAYGNSVEPKDTPAAEDLMATLMANVSSATASVEENITMASSAILSHAVDGMAFVKERMLAGYKNLMKMEL